VFVGRNLYFILNCGSSVKPHNIGLPQPHCQETKNCLH